MNLTRTCAVKSPDKANDLSQNWHLKGLRPVCVPESEFKSQTYQCSWLKLIRNQTYLNEYSNDFFSYTVFHIDNINTAALVYAFENGCVAHFECERLVDILSIYAVLMMNAFFDVVAICWLL